MLHLAAPSVLQLAHICYTTRGSDSNMIAFGPEGTFYILQASSLAKGLLPALWHKRWGGADDDSYTSSRAEALLWLKQHPATLAAIWCSFFSPGFCWFLWEALASATAGFHQRYQGVSPACGMDVPSDHVAFSNPGGAPSPAAVEYTHSGRDCLLDCLQFIHITQPAEHIAICLLSQQQEQQQEEEAEAAVAASGSKHVIKHGREAPNLHSSSRKADLNNSSRADRDGAGGGPATSSSSSSCADESSSSRCEKTNDNAGSRSGDRGCREGLPGRSSSSNNSRSGECSSTGVGPGEGSGKGGGSGGANHCCKGRNQGPTVEWLLLVGSSSDTADTWEGAAVNAAAAKAGKDSTMRGSQREQGLPPPAGQSLGGVSGPGSSTAAAVAPVGAEQGAAAAAGGSVSGAFGQTEPAGAQPAVAVGALKAAGGPAEGSSRQTRPRPQPATAEPAAAAAVTIGQLKLLVELLLLMWPCPRNQMYSLVNGTFQGATVISAHDWLLL